MKTVEFTDEELEMLRDLLQRTLHDMEREVFRTDHREFKEILRHRRELLERVTEKVGHAGVPA